MSAALQTRDRRRCAGILMPVFSLPSEHGIGCFDKEAREFITMLAVAGQSRWQILPLGPVGEGNSPYQPRSCFAGDPIYIDPVRLLEKNLITPREVVEMKGIMKASPEASGSRSLRAVNYHAVRNGREYIFQKAFDRFVPDQDYADFEQENRFWLEDYALFESMSTVFGTSSWDRWPDELRFRDPDALKRWTSKHWKLIDMNKWLQFEFFQEWNAILRFAHQRGINIIGDLPIYAAYESADCWAHPELFQLDSDLKRADVSGAPPDGFNPEGQVWGNPLYDWKYHRNTDFGWWISRIKHNLSMFDTLRLDHTRGFCAYYSVPAGEATGLHGHWEAGPGLEFFRAVEKALGPCDLIAEDLGFITDDVVEMVRAAGLPGMKVLQFAFDGDPDNPYLPENIREDSVVYTGTHDNDTSVGWFSSLDQGTREKITLYLREREGIRMSAAGRAPVFSSQSAAISLMQNALMTRAYMCIIPMGDYLLLGSQGRINTPGTVKGNWEWRMEKDAFTPELAASIRSSCRRCGRNN